MSSKGGSAHPLSTEAPTAVPKLLSSKPGSSPHTTIPSGVVTFYAGQTWVRGSCLLKACMGSPSRFLRNRTRHHEHSYQFIPKVLLTEVPTPKPKSKALNPNLTGSHMEDGNMVYMDYVENCFPCSLLKTSR